MKDYREKFESRLSSGATEKLPGWEKPHAKTVARSYDMEGRANKKTDQFFKVTSPFGWSSFQERRTWISWRNVQKHVRKMSWSACTWQELVHLTFFGQWTNLVEQSQNEQELVTNAWARLIFLTLSTHMITDNIDTAQPCRLGPFQDSDLAGDLEDSKSTKGDLMYLWKSNIRPHQLDVQEPYVSIPQLYRIRNHFVGCWATNGRATCSWFAGCGDRSVTFNEQHQNTSQSSSMKLLAVSQIQTQTKRKLRCWSIVVCGLRHHKRNFYSMRVSVVHLWRHWSSDQNDH